MLYTFAFECSKNLTNFVRKVERRVRKRMGECRKTHNHYAFPLRDIFEVDNIDSDYDDVW